ncbi:MAG TPA: MDR family MFS transporter, partial [Deinococcales bacterium]|nr:MDR family MFS transporter [Deinococcales bacterium]
MTTSAPPRPVLPALPVLTRQQKIFTLLGTLLGLFLGALDQTIVATAGPAIQRDLKIEAGLYTFLTTAYLVTSTVMVPIYGKLSDLFGRKIILLTGIGIFLLGSLLSGLSQTTTELILFRALQGAGSAALFTIAFAIVADIFPPAERGKYQGIFGAAFGLSSVIGPLVGGFLTDTISWHWVFFVNLPIGALAIAFIVARMPPLKRQLEHRPTLDLVGAFWLVLFTVPLLIALSLGKSTLNPGDTGFLWGSWQIIGMFALAAVSIAAFIFTERRAHDPILDLHMFQNRVFTWGVAATFVLGAGFLSAVVFLPLFMVNVVGLSATNSGLTTTPLTFAIVAGNIISGQLTSRLGRYKVLMIIGSFVLIVGFIIMGWTLTPDSTQLEVTLKMIVLGIGLGPSIPLYTLAITNAVTPDKIGAASAASAFFRQMGSTIGIAVLGTVFANAITTQMDSHVAPIVNSLPAQYRTQLAAGATGGGTGGEGQQLSFDAKAIKAQALDTLNRQEAVYVKAIRDNDPAAVKSVLADPNAPAQLKQALQAGGVKAAVDQQFDATLAAVTAAVKSGSPAAWAALTSNPKLPAQLRAGLNQIPAAALATPQGRAGVLAQVQGTLNAQRAAAEQAAVTGALNGVTTGLAKAKVEVPGIIDRFAAAFKQAFTDSISNIYRVGL